MSRHLNFFVFIKRCDINFVHKTQRGSDLLIHVLKFSRWQNSIKISRPDSRLKGFIKSDISVTKSIAIITAIRTDCVLLPVFTTPETQVLESQAAVFQYTVRSHRSDNGDWVGRRNVGFYKPLEAAVHPRNLYWIQIYCLRCAQPEPDCWLWWPRRQLVGNLSVMWDLPNMQHCLTCRVTYIYIYI